MNFNDFCSMTSALQSNGGNLFLYHQEPGTPTGLVQMGLTTHAMLTDINGIAEVTLTVGVTTLHVQFGNTFVTADATNTLMARGYCYKGNGVFDPIDLDVEGLVKLPILNSDSEPPKYLIAQERAGGSFLMEDTKFVIAPVLAGILGKEIKADTITYISDRREEREYQGWYSGSWAYSSNTVRLMYDMHTEMCQLVISRPDHQEKSHSHRIDVGDRIVFGDGTNVLLMTEPLETYIYLGGLCFVKCLLDKQFDN